MFVPRGPKKVDEVVEDELYHVNKLLVHQFNSDMNQNLQFIGGMGRPESTGMGGGAVRSCRIRQSTINMHT